MTGKVMNLSNYPHGFAGGLTVRDLPLAMPHPGKVFYVADGDTAGNTPAVPNRKGASDGNKGTYLDPFKTLDYAIGQCLADRGDIIVVLPGYVDTLVAGAEIDVDVDGVTIVGVGTGDKMPLIQYDHADATMEVNADNVTIMGLHFAASVTIVTIGLNIVDGADDFHIEGCRFSAQLLGTDEFVDAISVTTSDRGVIAYNYFDMDEAGAASAVHLVGVCLGCSIVGNYITGDYSAGCIESITTAQEQVKIEGNTLINGVHGGLNTVAAITMLTGSTGVIQNNQCYTNVAAAITGAIVADGCFFGGGNYVSTTAETPPAAIEGGGVNPIIRSSVCTGKADETDGLGLFTVTGSIYVHGITQRAEVAADSASALGVQVDATDTTLDSVLVTDTALTTETSVGDYAVSAAAGGAFTIVQVEDTTTSVMWNTPVLVPAGVIEQASSGTPGGLVSGYIVYWSEATAGATCVAV